MTLQTDVGPTRILIVEDDADIASLLARGLAAEGYATDWAQGQAEALELAGCRHFDAGIIDMMLGEGPRAERGSGLLAELRLRGVLWPAIMLSALSRVEDRAEGLAAGAQDYVVKPFQLGELIARLRVALMRAGPAAALRFAGLRYDPQARLVSGEGLAGRRVALTEREGELLAYLMARPGQVLSRGEIFDALWAPHGGATENVVDVYIGYLRRKLQPLADCGLVLQTLRGRGFVLRREEGGA